MCLISDEKQKARKIIKREVLQRNKKVKLQKKLLLHLQNLQRNFNDELTLAHRRISS